MAYFEQTKVTDILVALKAILNAIQRPYWLDPTTGKSRVIFSTDSSLATVSTVTTLNNLAGFDAKQSLLYSQERANWGVSIRSRIQ